MTEVQDLIAAWGIVIGLSVLSSGWDNESSLLSLLLWRQLEFTESDSGTRNDRNN